MKTIINMLSELNGTDDNIKCSALISREGWTYAFSAQQPSDEDDVSSLSAAIFAVSRISIAKLAGGAIKKITIEGDNSLIFIASLDQDLFLTTFAQKGSDVQAVFEQMSIFENKYAHLFNLDTPQYSWAIPSSQPQQSVCPA